MTQTIKAKAVNGTAWMLVERMSVQVCQFVIGIVLARLLLPDDYGVIGMLAIFMAIAQAILDSGFNRALIQKKNRDNVDYSTVFYFNFVISILIFGVFYVTAPLIADFYRTPILKDVTRVIAFTIIINGLTLVQTAKLTIELNFRLQALATVSSTLISGGIGIFMAYAGYGVWALVAQTITGALVRSAILWFCSHWVPERVFSVQSFKGLFSFGSKLLIGEFIHQIYTNMYTLVIGKAFNASDVGYYNRANGFAMLPPNIFGQVINKVVFPILSEKQDDNTSLLRAYDRMLRTPMFIFVPVMFLMAALSEPIIIGLIGEKWRYCIPLMQVLCIGHAFGPMSTMNLNLLYVKGRSDISLKLDLIKKPLGIAILFATIPLGLWWMCFGKAAYDLVAFAINCYYTKKLLNYGFLSQLSSLIKILVSSTIMFVVVIFIISFISNVWMKIIVGGLFGILLYAFITFTIKEPALQEVINISRSAIKKYKH